jgi:hypothetical protein
MAAIAAAVCVAVAAAGAPPADAQEHAQAVGEAAVAMLDYPVETLGWEIRFLPGRTGFLGLAIGPKRRIEIYVRSTQSVTDIAHTLAHEVGHAVDLTYGTGYRHREYLRMRGFDLDTEWFGCDECSDYATPAGDFAEVFEYWLLGGGDFRSQLGSPPDTQRLEEISHLFVAPYQPSVRVFWRQRWQPDG